MTSAPAVISALHRSLSLGLVPIAAPTNSCLFWSFDASGKSRAFFKSAHAKLMTRKVRNQNESVGCVQSYHIDYKDLCLG